MRQRAVVSGARHGETLSLGGQTHVRSTTSTTAHRNGLSKGGASASRPTGRAVWRVCLVCGLGLVVVSTGCRGRNAPGRAALEFAQRLGENLTGTTPLDNVKSMEDEYFADERREGINRLVIKRRDFARQPPYTTRYRQIAQLDSDWLVRATAVRALNISRDKTSTDIYIAALSDEHPRVRLEGAKALHNMPDQAAVPRLLQLLGNADELVDVRIAAAQALKRYETLDVARQLATTLNARDFGVAWQARRSLRQMTGQDFQYDDAAWLSYLTGRPNPFI